MASLWAELKRRNVVRVAIAYVIVSWLVLQLTDVLVSLLTLPDWVGRFVFLLLLIGLPIALFFAWAFEVTPDGVKKEKDVDRSQSLTHTTGRKLDFVIIGVLTIALAFFVVDKYVLEPDTDLTIVSQTEIVATEKQHSIAVLPFVNMSSDPEQEYFSDGLSEEILNLLAKVHDLKVIARTSSFAFKGKNEDIRTIGKTLDVSTVLEGSVRKAGERVRITAQLINVADGAHLWSETYDRTLNDIFAVQDDVAAEILDALQIHVSAAPKRGRPTQSTEAYTLFLKARAAINSFRYPEAEAFLTQSIALDPKFAEAHEMLAYTHWWQGGVDAIDSQRHVLRAAADALAIDPSLLFAQALLVEAEGASYLKSIEAYERVLRQNPNHVGTMDNLAWNLVFTGYVRESEALAQRFAEIDPLSTSAQRALAESLGPVGRVDECLAAIDAFRHLNRETGPFTGSFCLPHDKRAENSLAHIESYLQREGLPTDLIRELAAGASDPTTGQALLDRLIPLIVAPVSNEFAWLVSLELHSLYLSYGFLDRYYEIIDPASVHATEWSDTANLVFIGQLFWQSGFTTHPRYLEAAEANGLIELWDQRGAPDHCEKIEGLWVCE